MGNWRILLLICLSSNADANLHRNHNPDNGFVGVSQFDKLTELPKSSIITINEALSDDQLKSLQRNAAVLENASDESRTWWCEDRPYLLELVDPLKYCFVNGVTRTKGNSSLLTDHFSNSSSDKSKMFQLLPTEISEGPISGNISIKSYINNLHPRKYQTLYSSLETVIKAALPLLLEVIKDITPGKKKSTIKTNDRTFQFIIGIKSIKLQPKATFGGSDWHTEGLGNEHIIASAIYYYEVENIRNSELHFRAPLDSIHENYTYFGPVVAQRNRMVVFPNTYEHILKPFNLKRAARPGYRKIISLMLVDPSVKILSTADVLPQQESWKEGSIANQEGNTPDILGLDLGHNSGCCTMTSETAKKYFLLAITERKHGPVNKIDKRYN